MLFVLLFQRSPNTIVVIIRKLSVASRDTFCYSTYTINLRKNGPNNYKTLFGTFDSPELIQLKSTNIIYLQVDDVVRVFSIYYK